MSYILLAAAFTIGGYIWLVNIDWRIAAAVFSVMLGAELRQRIVYGR